MIIKPHRVPVYIHKLEALLRRLPHTHSMRKRVEEILAKQIAGYRGELGIDYPLSFLPEKDYYILHDIRLFDGSHYFQLDTLIISPKFILIVEVKNISGKLFFDSDFKQLIRTVDEKEEPFPDPILQVERQSYQLLKWLRLHKYNYIPIEPIVVVSSTRAILRTSPDNQEIFDKVLLNSRLPAKIEKLSKMHQKEYYRPNIIQKLSKKILSEHTPLERNILLQFEITEREIVKGVQCPNCVISIMQRARGKWVCPACELLSKDAHISALEDYMLLFAPTINNKQLRHFLNLSSSAVSRNLLQALNLPFTGNNKSRCYNLSSLQKKHPPTKRMQK